MKIGVITLSNYNFGSALQYYATQEYLGRYYCDCVLIEEETSRSCYLSKVRTLVLLAEKCIFYPADAKLILQHVTAKRFSGLTISSKSLDEIRKFRSNYFALESYTSKELKRIAHTDRFDYFFSGSDQVWNGARVDGHALYFLRFAPKEKRIAWSPSFGGEQVMRYNRKRYAKYIDAYYRLSAREESGRKQILKLTGRDVPALCDPVMLFTGEQWRNEYRDRVQLQLDEPFVLLFFLNEVSPTAISFAQKFCSDRKVKCVSFGYFYTAYKQLDNYHHYDGSPFDFLYVLDHATAVVTDSYHATVFSTLFHTDFYVFSRNYTHGQNQSTRLTYFLNSIGAPKRFNPASECPLTDFSSAESFFTNERLKADDYLESSLGVEKKKTERVVLFQNPSQCCGCSACVDACPKKAISMRSTVLPQIDEDLCVGCRKCLSVCGLKRLPSQNEFDKKAYIGIGEDTNLTSKSASGGVFAAMAQHILSHGGIVYGAALEFSQGYISCRHIRIDDVRDLHQIQNSKYVQSDTSGVFPLVKKDLENGRTILFSGTSCQVASLQAYLGERHYENLTTADLICHGVPTVELLREYIDYIESMTRESVIDFSFRTKDRSISSQIPYVISVTTKNETGEVKQRYYPLRSSAYYRLFMAFSGYRDSCYCCKFATIDKPADITLGDYYLQESRTNALCQLGKRNIDLYSCVIVHSQSGEDLLRRTGLHLCEVVVEKAIADHAQLQKPSAPSDIGIRMLRIYRRRGFKGLQAYIDRKNHVIDIVKKAIKRSTSR